MSDVATIFIKGFFAILMASAMIAGLLFVVGETVDHFTPAVSTSREPSNG